MAYRHWPQSDTRLLPISLDSDQPAERRAFTNSVAEIWPRFRASI